MKLNDNKIVESNTRQCIDKIIAAPKDARSNDDIRNLIGLVSELDKHLQEELGEKFPLTVLSEIVELLEDVWKVLLIYFKIRRGSEVHTSVTDGQVLRYKIVRVFADAVEAEKLQGFIDFTVREDLTIRHSLIEFIHHDLDRSENRNRSFSHMAVKALVFLDRNRQNQDTYTMIKNGVRDVEIDPSYLGYLPRKFRRKISP